jgi:hypothetical protein
MTLQKIILKLKHLFIKKINSEPSDFFRNDLKKLSQFGFQKFGIFNRDDVFIIGYPKSGNTLLQHIIAHLIFGLHKNASKSLINSCVTEYYNNPWFFRHDKTHFFKSHELPKPEYRNVIYIVRDGREAVRSYYYMLTNMGKEVSIKDLYLTGGDTFVGNWNDHVQAWTNNPYDANILFITYENLIQNKLKELQRICEFLKVKKTNEELNNVIEATSLGNMKLMETSFSWQRMKAIQEWNSEGNFVREGKQKGFEKDLMISDELIKEFNAISNEMLIEYGYIN